MSRQSTGISASAPPSFEVTDLCKSFDGETMVNDGISLRVEPGEVFGLLGPNGVGKTTLVKQIIGLLKPDSGSITLGGYDLVADPSHARQLCSLLPQVAVPIESFKSREAVDLAGQIRGGDRSGVRARRKELFGALDLDEWSDTLGTNLSGGVRRPVDRCPGGDHTGDLLPRVTDIAAVCLDGQSRSTIPDRKVTGNVTVPTEAKRETDDKRRSMAESLL